MRILALATAAFLFCMTLVGAAVVQAAPEKVLGERAIGRVGAPIIVDEYASLTCSHCAEFFVKTLPILQKKYVDTGKVRFVFHEFPLDGIALKAAALAYCMPEAQFFPFMNILFKNQMAWALANAPEDVIIQYAKLGGLDESTGRTCMKDSRLLDALVAERTSAAEKWKIAATPTFIINGGAEKLVGARELKDFEQTFDRLLAGK